MTNNHATRRAPARAKQPADPAETMRRIARGYPEVEETDSCVKVAFKAGKKSFLFVGADERSYNAMVKLGDSLAEAAALAAEQPNHYKVGVHGWVTLAFARDESPPDGLLARWIDESYRLLAPAKLVATLPDRAASATRATKATKKAAGNKPAGKRAAANKPAANKPAGKKPAANKPTKKPATRKSATAKKSATRKSATAKSPRARHGST